MYTIIDRFSYLTWGEFLKLSSENLVLEERLFIGHLYW